MYLHDSSHLNISLARHSITHARLISGFRDGTSNGVLFHYSNLCHWREFVRDIASASRYTRGAIMQMLSRAIIAILKSNGSTEVEANMIHSSQTIERDMMTTCSEYIEHEYQESDRGDFTGGFVEAYDIFAASVVIISLTGRYIRPSAVTNIMNKCTALLTTVGEKFVGLKVFRRVLWDLSDAVSGNPQSASTIHELPSVIPDGIRDLIAEVLKRNTVMENQ